MRPIGRAVAAGHLERPRGRAASLVVRRLAGCGGSTVPPGSGRRRSAPRSGPWRTQIAELNAQAQQQVSRRQSPAQIRDTCWPCWAAAEQASETARAAVAAAGIPDVDGGDEVAARFADSLTGARDAYRHARTPTCGSLPTADAASFYDGVAAVLAQAADRVRGERAGHVQPGLAGPTRGIRRSRSVSVIRQLSLLGADGSAPEPD